MPRHQSLVPPLRFWFKGSAFWGFGVTVFGVVAGATYDSWVVVVGGLLALGLWYSLAREHAESDRERLELPKRIADEMGGFTARLQEAERVIAGYRSGAIPIGEADARLATLFEQMAEAFGKAAQNDLLGVEATGALSQLLYGDTEADPRGRIDAARKVLKDYYRQRTAGLAAASKSAVVSL